MAFADFCLSAFARVHCLLLHACRMGDGVAAMRKQYLHVTSLASCIACMSVSRWCYA